jgi:hypothetical protein
MPTPEEHPDDAPDRRCRLCIHVYAEHPDGGPCSGTDGHCTCPGFDPSPDYATPADTPAPTSSTEEAP